MTSGTPDAPAGRLAGETALITGSAGGIGRAIARLFAAEGARAAIADIDGTGAKRVAESIEEDGHQALAVRVDITDEPAVARGSAGAQHLRRRGRPSQQRCGKPPDRLLEMSPADWDKDIALTLTAPFICTRAVLPHMLASGQGVILNIASLNAFVSLGNEGYSAAKAGLVNLTKSIAVRYAPKGVRANAIAPGTIVTQVPNNQTRLTRDPGLFARLRKWYPLGRLGQPGDVARAALFLCSADAGWITGTTLRVDGGLLAGNGPLTRELQGWAGDD